MKRIAVIAAAVSVAFFSARANDVLQLTEVGEDPALITVTFNGSPLAGVMQTKTAPNDWSIQLPAGFDITGLGPIGVTIFGELEPNLFSIIEHGNNVTSGPNLIFISDIPAPGAGGPNPLTITNAGTGPSGGALDLVVSDTAGATVPDTGSTLGLLGLSLIASLGATRLRSLRVA